MNAYDIKYIKISNNKIPFENNHFNYAVSIFVMLEISTVTELLVIFKEIYRVLKPGCFFSFLTNSEYLYSKSWLSNSTTYPSDKVFYNGERVKIFSKNIGKELYDYYWDHTTYLNVMKKAGFICKKTKFPLGNAKDPYVWLDESVFPPFALYTGQKMF